jgi:hypothetical protein
MRPALPQAADITQRDRHVRIVPKADADILFALTEADQGR